MQSYAVDDARVGVVPAQQFSFWKSKRLKSHLMSLRLIVRLRGRGEWLSLRAFTQVDARLQAQWH